MKHQTITEFTESYVGRKRVVESAEKPLTVAEVKAAAKAAVDNVIDEAFKPAKTISETLAALPDGSLSAVAEKVVGDRVTAEDPAAKSREFWGDIFAPPKQEG